MNNKRDEEEEEEKEKKIKEDKGVNRLKVGK